MDLRIVVSSVFKTAYAGVRIRSETVYDKRIFCGVVV